MLATAPQPAEVTKVPVIFERVLKGSDVPMPKVSRTLAPPGERVQDGETHA
jgi:hypothetical protein